MYLIGNYFEIVVCRNRLLEIKGGGFVYGVGFRGYYILLDNDVGKCCF